MKIEKLSSDTWRATGAGHIRPIIVEAASQAEAREAFTYLFRQQLDQWRMQNRPAPEHRHLV